MVLVLPRREHVVRHLLTLHVLVFSPRWSGTPYRADPRGRSSRVLDLTRRDRAGGLSAPGPRGGDYSGRSDAARARVTWTGGSASGFHQSQKRSFGPALQRYPTKHCGVSRLGTKAGS